MPTSSGEPDGRPSAHLLVSGVTAGYGAAPVVVDASVAAGPGEIVSIVGPNGAGKSTLLKALVGAIGISSGRIALGGREISRLRTDERARLGLGYVPQVNDIFDALSVAENLEMGGYLLAGKDLQARMAAVYALFPVLEGMQRRNASKLSGGERKMLAIGRVLMLEPSLLILDEPTAGLSPQLSELLLNDYIRRLAGSGAAVLLVEQRATAALGISDWAYIMVAGSMRMDGPAGALLARPDIGEIFLGRAVEPAPSRIVTEEKGYGHANTGLSAG